MKKPHERQLVCELMGRAMLPALETDDPWNLDYWLGRGWRAGVVQAKFAPDTIETLLSEAGGKYVNYCRELYRDCVLETAEGEGRPNLEAAFERYLSETEDCGLHVPEIRALNPRLLAARAYDFVVWMAFFMPCQLARGAQQRDTVYSALGRGDQSSNGLTKSFHSFLSRWSCTHSLSED